MAKAPGRDCWWATCDKTVDDEPLWRSAPKGQPGDFMCAQHVAQKALEARG